MGLANAEAFVGPLARDRHDPVALAEPGERFFTDIIS